MKTAGQGGKEGGGFGGEEMGSGPTTVVKKKRNQPTRSSARLRNETRYFEVFNNHLLLEKILEYLLLDAGCDLDANRKAACSLRLVDKTWNETVSKVLHKNEQPLFRLSSFYPARLARFCNTFASSTEINGCAPPFSLTVYKRHPEIVQELCNLLIHCGAGLAKLKIYTNLSGPPCKSEFPKWSLDRLRKLDVTLELDQNSSLNGREEDATFGKDGQGTVGSCLLNSVLRGAKSIACFEMTLNFKSPSPPDVRHSILESVTLPPSLTNLEVRGYLRTQHLEILATKILPSLSSLTLICMDKYFVDGLLFKILDNFRASLKTLSIYGYYYMREEPRSVFLVSFPVMNQLEDVFISSLNLELEPTGLHSLPSCFPKLHTLRLDCQTGDMLRKWIGDSKYISVTRLQFYLADENFDECDVLNFVKGLSMETMQRVNLGFPNLRKLELCLSGRDTSGLEYVFKEMTRLTDLTLCYDKLAPEVNSDFWDAVLTGLPLETLARLRISPDLWEGNELNKEEVGVSIKNLQELASLSLYENRPLVKIMYYTVPSKDVMPPFISDLTFRFALFQMPKLKNLTLQGRFKASGEMTDEWRNRGRVLENIEESDEAN